MPRPYLVLEAVPSAETPADLDRKGYAALARQQGAAYIAQLRRRFGPEPEGAALKVRAMPHDAGTYYTVVCYYDSRPVRSRRSHTPASWVTGSPATWSPGVAGAGRGVAGGAVGQRRVFYFRPGYDKEEPVLRILENVVRWLAERAK